MKARTEIKISEEHLIALIRGTKLNIATDGVEISIIPPLYDSSDRFKNAFEMGQEFQRQAEIYLDLASRNEQSEWLRVKSS